MTATVGPDRSPPGGPPPPHPGPGPDQTTSPPRASGSRATPHATPGDPDPTGAELALAAVTVIAIAGMARLFADDVVLVDVVLAGLLAHLVGAGARRVGLGSILGALVHVGGAVGLIAWLRYPDLLVWGLPGREAFEAAAADIAEAWDAFGIVKAPVEVLPGFVVASMVAAWLCGAAADTGAFRARLPVQALIPSATLVVFVGMLGTDERHTFGAAAWIAAALAFLVIERQRHRRGRSAAARHRGRHLVRLGVGLALIAGLAGLITGPLVPGADEEALVDWKSLDGGNGSGARTALSPLVDIRGRLTEQSDDELFTVTADEPAYWRTTALDRFEDDVWRFEGSYRELSGPLPTAADPAEATEIVQTVEVGALDSVWLPAAFVPVSLGDGAGVRYNAESATLFRGDGIEGLTYEVTSAVPRHDAETLRQTTGPVDAAFVERNTDLPEDFSPAARAEAERITAGLTNDYDRARALQDFFLANFTYDLAVGGGHSSDRVEAFLEQRRGYCEQFAGTMAAMARHLGIPARVAVGFTWGETTAAETYLVRGRNYHAWPEVHFAGIGWVAFEPTPGRGAPGNQSYTGVPPQQASEDGAVPPSTTVAPVEVPDVGALTPGLATPDLPEAAPSAPSAADDGGLGPVTWALLGLLALTGLAVVGVPSLRRRVQRGRCTSAPDPAARVRAAWRGLEQAVACTHGAPYETESHVSYARRIAGALGLPRADLDGVAEAADAATFGGPVTAGDADRAVATITGLIRRIEGSGDRRTRWRRRLDPRPLLLAWPRRRRGAAPSSPRTPDRSRRPVRGLTSGHG